MGNDVAYMCIGFGVGCVVVLIALSGSCSSEDWVTWIGVLSVIVGAALFAAAVFILTQNRSASRWKPSVAALVTLLLVTAVLAAIALSSIANECAR